MANLTPKQVSDELRRFVNSAEAALSSQNVQIKYHGAGLAEVALLLQHLKDTLFYETKLQRDFISDFVSKGYNGVELLLRTLSVLQRLLHEATQQPTSKLSTLLHRNASNKRRKAGIAEADCLNCVKIITQKMPSAWHGIIERVTFVEIVLISVTSPQLDSKCFALEILTLLLDLPVGFMVVYKALTSVAGKNRDNNRMDIIVSQLKHGLNTSRLHIQILVLKFVNKILAQAPELNYRVIMQAETENAGLYADRLEKVCAQYGYAPDVELLNRELQIWRSNYLSLIWLEKQALAYTMGTQPVDFLRKGQGIANGDLSSNKTYSYKQDTDSSTKNGDDDFDSTMHSDRTNGYRPYKPMKSSSSTGPFNRDINRKRQLYTPQPTSRRWSASNGSVPRQDEPDRIVLESNPSYTPVPYANENMRNEYKEKHAKQTSRASSMPSYAEKNGHQPEGILKRTKSDQMLGYNQDSLRSDASQRTPREEQIFRQLSKKSGNRPVSPVRFADEEAEKQRWRSRQNVEFATPSNGREWTIPVTRLKTPAPDERPEPEGRSIFVNREENSPRKLYRTSSTTSEKARMQGFSYLFPENPIIEDLPKRRSKTPTPLQEQVILHTTETQTPTDVRYSTMPTGATTTGKQYDYSNGFRQSSPPVTKQQNGEVVYIPVRVEETGQVVNRLNRSQKQQLGGYPSSDYPTSNKSSSPSSYHNGSKSTNGGGGFDDFNRPSKTSYYGHDVEDALKRFDYLNDYSAEEGSRSSRFTAGT